MDLPPLSLGAKNRGKRVRKLEAMGWAVQSTAQCTPVQQSRIHPCSRAVYSNLSSSLSCPMAGAGSALEQENCLLTLWVQIAKQRSLQKCEPVIQLSYSIGLGHRPMIFLPSRRFIEKVACDGSIIGWWAVLPDVATVWPDYWFHYISVGRGMPECCTSLPILLLAFIL